MSKLVPDRKVCWQDQYGGWHVGVTFTDCDGQPVENDKGYNCLVRHKHTGEIEWIPHRYLSNYPMEPIPEPGKDSIVDQLLEKDRQGCEDMAEAMINRFRQDKIPEPGEAPHTPPLPWVHEPHREDVVWPTDLLTLPEPNRLLESLWPRKTDLAWEEDCEKDILGPGSHVLSPDDRSKLEEAIKCRAEKFARVRAMEESLARWKPVNMQQQKDPVVECDWLTKVESRIPKLEDLYREPQTYCIGVPPKE